MYVVEKLIENFVPDNYDLVIEIDRKDRKIYGNMIITGNASTSSESIKLHSKDLTIKSIRVNKKLVDFSIGANDILTIKSPSLANHKYTLNINYSGEISDAMHGIYPCYYKHNDVEKELIATQFESHHAREVFPCIDEPSAKATFDVALITENNVTVVGNTPILRQSEVENRLITRFETTPKMSSYLLAWVVGELHKKTAYTKNGVEVNVWATPAQPAENLDFALEIATKSIDFFNEYFDTPYPLPKCDHVALPDFSSGAMENWGLITYREIALLVDPKKTSIASRQYVATVIAHELSHQWFGNLVTMKWWNDLWLNESFASLIEYLAVDNIMPEWNVWLDFASNDCVIALRRDSLDGVQPVQVDVNHPDEISTLFDGAIVYAKGARLIQMLWRYIGEKAFQTGLKSYFKEFAYKNTEASDLWRHFEKASGKDISSLMNKWISQPGFPVLHASLNQTELTLTQNRLSTQDNNSSDTIWPITLNSNLKEVPEIFDQKTISVAVDDHQTIRFNQGNYAHFITHYDENLLRKVLAQLKSGELSTIDRLQLLNEQLLLAQAGIISSSDLIPIIDAYQNEDTEAVWSIINLAINYLHRIVEHDEITEKALKNLAGKLATPLYKTLGFKDVSGEPEDNKKLRQIIISLMLYSENKPTIAKAIELYELNEINKLNPELRSLIIAAVVKFNSSDQLIEILLSIYKSTSSTELQQDIKSALTTTRKNDVAEKLLFYIKDKTFIRSQDATSWIIGLVRNKHTRQATWQWIQDNWQWINDSFSGDKSYDYYPRYIATALSTEDQLGEYEAFFNPMINDPSLTRVIKIGKNEIKDRINLIKRDYGSLKTAIDNYSKR